MRASLSVLIRDTDKLVGQYEARERHRQELDAEVGRLRAEEQLLGLTEAALTALLQQTSSANLQAIESLITSGLQAVFDDLALSFHFEVETQRGQQSLTPVIASHGVVAGPILDSHGGGPAQVVALLLRLLTVHRLGLHPTVLLDESLSMVSDRYVGNCASFIRGLCSRLGLTVLLVTHQPAFAREATRAYEIGSTPQGATLTEVTGS